jgi:hypothetical protein
VRVRWRVGVRVEIRPLQHQNHVLSHAYVASSMNININMCSPKVEFITSFGCLLLVCCLSCSRLPLPAHATAILHGSSVATSS